MIKAILGLSGEQQNLERWDVLDFGAIERALASKITDDLLQVILILLDANRKLKILKLTGCVNVTGAGLGLLRGSAILQQIDLSLVPQHKSPVFHPVFHGKPLISCEQVLPVLYSIIERYDNRINSIVFPKSWRYDGNTALNEFLVRCYRYREIERGHVACANCEQGVRRLLFSRSGEYYGIQFFTCNCCMKHLCYDCEDENGVHLLSFCQICEKDYCMDCVAMKRCVACYRHFCNKCQSLVECGGCDANFCHDCVKYTESCDKCSRTFCGDCGYCYVIRCNNCGRGYCDGCRKSNEASFCDQCFPE